MFDPSFRQQTSAWQRQFQLRTQGSWWQRLLAWLALGVLLVVGAMFLIFAIMLSWILIPVLVYRHRRRMRQFREQAARYQQAASGQSAYGQIIEGEVLHKNEPEQRDR